MSHSAQGRMAWKAWLMVFMDEARRDVVSNRRLEESCSPCRACFRWLWWEMGGSLAGMAVVASLASVSVCRMLGVILRQSLDLVQEAGVAVMDVEWRTDEWMEKQEQSVTGWEGKDVCYIRGRCVDSRGQGGRGKATGTETP